MYQSAFLSLEFSLNWVVVNYRLGVLILKFRQKFKFAFHKNLTLLINRRNKVFQLPGLIFSILALILTAAKGKIRKYSLKNE